MIWMNEPTIDQSMFDSLVESTGEDFVRVLIDDFLTEAAENIAALHKALDEQDAPTFHRAAHTLKSSGGYLGTAALSACCRELEMIGKSGDITAPNTAEKLWQLEDEFQLARAALVEWQQSAG